MKENFYRKLSSAGKAHYDVQESVKPHSDEFKRLMNQQAKSKGARGLMFYTTEEIEFLGKEDLATLMDLHKGEAEYYMSW